MGLGYSIQASNTQQTLREYTNIVNVVANSAYNNANMTCSSSNTGNVTAGIDCDFSMRGGSFVVKQVAVSTCNFKSNNANVAISKFNNDIYNKTEVFINQNAQSKQGWFSTAFSLQINNATNTTEVINNIKNEINNNFVTNCNSVATAVNNGNLNLCGYYQDANVILDQYAFVNAITSCWNEAIMNAFSKNEALNNMWIKTDQKLYSEQEGVGSLFSWIVLVVGAIVGVIVLIVVSILIIVAIKSATSSGTPQINTLPSTFSGTAINPISIPRNARVRY